MMKRTIGLVLVLVVVMVLAGSLQADLVNLNRTYGGERPSGAAAIGTAGDYWNNLYVSQTSMALMNSANEDSGITATFNQTGGWHAGTVSSAGPLFYAYWGPNDSGTNDYVVFSGFAQGDKVDIYCYSAQAGGSGSGQLFRWTEGTDVLASARGTNKGNVTSYVEGENYVVLKGVTPDANGEIKIRSVYSWHPTNGYQLDITSVPEPATAAVLLSGGVLGLIRKTKK